MARVLPPASRGHGRGCRGWAGTVEANLAWFLGDSTSRVPPSTDPQKALVKDGVCAEGTAEMAHRPPQLVDLEQAGKEKCWCFF